MKSLDSLPLQSRRCTRSSATKRTSSREVVTSVVDEAATPVFAEVSILPEGGNLESDLRDLASRLLARVIQPRLLQLRRLVISEAGRFPELGRLFYERGPAGPSARSPMRLSVLLQVGNCESRIRRSQPNTSTGSSCRFRSTG